MAVGEKRGSELPSGAADTLDDDDFAIVTIDGVTKQVPLPVLRAYTTPDWSVDYVTGSELSTALGDYVGKASFDAAGDLLVGTGDNTFARLAKGSALQMLRVNAAGTGLEFANPPDPGGARTIEVAAGTGVTATDEAALAAAFAAANVAGDGTTIDLYPGSIYSVADLEWLLTADRVTLRGVGAQIRASTAATSYGLRIAGDKGTIVTVSSGATIGSETIVLSTSAHGIVAGDIIVVGSDDGFMDENTTFTGGEYAWVESVSSATLTLAHALRNTYTTDPRVAKYTMPRHLRIEGVDFTVDAATTNRVFPLWVQYLYNPHFANVYVFGNDVARDGIFVEECFAGGDTDCYYERCTDEFRPSSSVTEGYSQYHVGVEGWNSQGAFVYRCKHSHDWNSYGGGDNPRSVSRNCNIVNIVAFETYSAGLSSHTASEAIHWTNAKSIWCGGGAIVRGPHSSITGLRVSGHQYEAMPDGDFYGYDFGVWVGTGSGTGNAGDGFSLKGLRMDTRAKSSTSRGISAVRVDDRMRNASITDIVAKGLTEAGITFRGKETSDVYLADFDLDLDDSFEGHGGVVITPGGVEARRSQTAGTVTAGDYADRVVIERGVVRNCRGNPITVIGGDTTRHSRGLTIRNFTALSPDSGADATTPVVMFRNGFVDDVEVDPIEAPDTTGPWVDYSSATITWRKTSRAGGVCDFAGYLGWAYDPYQATSNLTPTSGRLYGTVVDVAPGQITHLAIMVITAGSGLTAGQSFMAVHRPGAAGALLGQTVDASTSFQSTGVRILALASPINWPGGPLAIDVWTVGGTAPVFARGGSSVVGNLGASAEPYRYRHSNATTYTTTAPSTWPTQTASNDMLWMGVKGSRFN